MSQGLTIREVLTGHIQPRERGEGMTALEEYPHIYVKDMEHYEKARKFAESLGGESLDSLIEQFQRAETIAERDNETVEVFPDCVPYSFYFRTYNKDGKLLMDGGIICHGIGECFSAELCPKEGVHWSTHT